MLKVLRAFNVYKPRNAKKQNHKQILKELLGHQQSHSKQVYSGSKVGATLQSV